MSSLSEQSLALNVNSTTSSNLNEQMSTTNFNEQMTAPYLPGTSAPSSPPSGAIRNSISFRSEVRNSEHVKERFKRTKRRHSYHSCRGTVKPWLEENQQLKREMEGMENQLAAFQAQMPSIYDDLEEKANEIGYLKSALESSQRKYQILNERQKKMELKMTWNDEDIKEELSKISKKSYAEKERIKDRLLKEVKRLSQELSIETHERNVLVNDLVSLKKQLAKLRKDKDDERESYLFSIEELQRACRAITKEKNKYRIDIEEMRELVFSLECELEKQKGLVSEKEQLVESLREELSRVENSNCGSKKRSSVRTTSLPGNLAAELLHNENLIGELREEKFNAEEDFADCREHLEHVLEMMEYAVSAIIPASESGDGLSRIEKAIADTRDYLGLQPATQEEIAPEEPEISRLVKPSESFDESTLYNTNLVLERNTIGTGYDEVDWGEFFEKEENKSSNKVVEKDLIPQNFVKMEEFKQAVFKEVSKIKMDILDEFKQLTQDHLRTSVAEEQLMDTIQNSSQNSAKAVISWIEQDRKATRESELSTELQRLTAASQRCLKEEKEKNEEVVKRMKKTISSLEAELKTATSEIQSLKKQVQKIAVERLRLKAGSERRQSNKTYKIKLTEVRKIATLEITPENHFLQNRRIHRLDTMAGLETGEQRQIVTAFFVTYSNVSSWETFRDPNLQTTLYMFEFHGSMWKTRISFLYPFVNYITQATGVNKKALGSVLIILPTSTVSMKINNLASAFKRIQKTLETHNNDNLWNYIFIFLKNVAAHYGYIKRFVGSRTRTRTVNSRTKSRRAVTQRLESTGKEVNVMPRRNTTHPSSTRSRGIRTVPQFGTAAELSLEMKNSSLFNLG